MDVVVDCDPGVDDALALLALAGLRSTGTVRVTAVTAVAGNAPVNVTARNAAHVVARSSLEGVPVLAGPPRTATLREDHHGPDGLGGFGPAAGAPPGAAVPDTAVDTLASRLAEGAVILALGPLTNVAAAVQRVSGGVGPGTRVVVMGGGPDGEFNFAFDREAAATVLSSGVAVTQVPIDVTQKVLFTAEDAAVLPRSAAGGLVADLLDWTVAARPGEPAAAPVHDAVALVALVAPDLVTTRPAGGCHPVDVVIDCDAAAVHQLLMELWGVTIRRTPRTGRT